MCCENAPYDIFIYGDAKLQGNNLCDARAAISRIAWFQFNDGTDEGIGGPFGASRMRVFGVNRR